MGAHQGRDVGRGEGQAEAKRHGALRRAATAAVHRAGGRRQAGVLLLDEPTSALDPISTPRSRN
jgi:ABC-type transporter Mla maintaining outer membrane lipid asymmetry ATPase subunit MlaF